MKLIVPATINSSNLTSNVAETLAEYSAGTTYALGNQVRSAATNHAYESLANSNLGNALTDETKWLDLGATNRYAMFDTINGTLTSNPTIDVSAVFTGARSDGLALFNLTASNVQVTVTTAADGLVYDETYSLVSTVGIVTWYDYFFQPISYSTDLVLTDLPVGASPTVRVRITASSGNVSCGNMVCGQVTEIGGTVYGAKAGIQDYSKKTVDDFGNYTVVARGFAKRLTCKIVVDHDKVDRFYQQLASVRATPCVWIGADAYTSTASLGFWKDYAVEISSVNKSYLALEIEGLT